MLVEVLGLGRVLLPLLGFVVVALAHARKNRLLAAVAHRTKLLFGTVRDTASALNSHLGASRCFAAFAGGSVSRTETGLLDVLVASRVLAGLALGTVRNTEAALDDTVGAATNIALATDTLASASSREFGVSLVRSFVLAATAAAATVCWASVARQRSRGWRDRTTVFRVGRLEVAQEGVIWVDSQIQKGN